MSPCALTYSKAFLTILLSSAGESPTFSSRTSTASDLLVSASVATTTLWYPRAALPYLSVLYAERVVLRMPLPSIRMWWITYFGPSLPIVMCPSHSETDSLSMRLRIWPKTGTRNLPAASRLSIPSIWRHFAPVATRYSGVHS